jgi:hypothetical protein
LILSKIKISKEKEYEGIVKYWIQIVQTDNQDLGKQCLMDGAEGWTSYINKV